MGFIESDEDFDDCARESSEFQTSGFNTPMHSVETLESEERAGCGREQEGTWNLV